MPQVTLSAEPTPNPNAVKFTLNTPLPISGSKSYRSPEEAQGSLLAQALFLVPGVDHIFMMNHFITVIKKMDAGWGAMIPLLEKAILENIKSS